MSPKARVSAVSYLNTLPLVWGMLHGPQADVFDLRFELPSACADSVRTGTASIGLVPVIEAFRQNLEIISDLGIASDGPVRSIFLLHRKPLREIKSVALDPSSRTSVALVRILLAECYGLQPEQRQPGTDADAALLIGDPALRMNQNGISGEFLDLGAAWQQFAGLPMVYALWAGRAREIPGGSRDVFRQSYEFGREHLDEIIRREAEPRQVSEVIAKQYFAHNIRYEIDARARAGLLEFKRLARRHYLL